MDYSTKPRAPQTIGGAGLGASFPSDACQAVQERKPSNTEQAVKSLEGATARLDALVSELERRISPVLMPCPPQAGQGEARPSGCQLAEKLFSEETALRTIAERIDSIISRVDL